MGHHHHHHHENDQAATMTFPEKLHKLLEHWVQHNNSHVDTYRQWAADAGANGLDDVAGLLNRAAAQTEAVSELFESARNTLSTPGTD